MRNKHTIYGNFEVFAELEICNLVSKENLKVSQLRPRSQVTPVFLVHCPSSDAVQRKKNLSDILYLGRDDVKCLFLSVKFIREYQRRNPISSWRRCLPLWCSVRDTGNAKPPDLAVFNSGRLSHDRSLQFSQVTSAPFFFSYFLFSVHDTVKQKLSLFHIYHTNMFPFRGTI